MKYLLGILFCVAAVITAGNRRNAELVRSHDGKLITSKPLSDTDSALERHHPIKFLSKQEKPSSFLQILSQRGGFKDKKEPSLSTSTENIPAGSIFSNIALVCGTTVGAGILALPRQFTIMILFYYCTIKCCSIHNLQICTNLYVFMKYSLPH